VEALLRQLSKKEYRETLRDGISFTRGILETEFSFQPANKTKNPS